MSNGNACAPEFEDLKGLVVQKVIKDSRSRIEIMLSNGKFLTITAHMDISPYGISPILNISQGLWTEIKTQHRPSIIPKSNKEEEGRCSHE